MGAWDTGPFDSDHAADFASSVIQASSPEARHDLFSITFGAFMDMPDDHPDLFGMEDGYELPSIIEEVIASAAYVSDGAAGDTRWISSVYARGSELWDAEQFVELGDVPINLVADAHSAVSKAHRLMRRAGIGSAWTATPEQLLTELEGMLH